MSRHAATATAGEPDHAVLLTRLLVQIRWSLAAANGLSAAALFADAPGTSPSLAFLMVIAPLWLWAMLFGAAAVLLVTAWAEIGHLLAVPGWAALATGSALGILTERSGSPSGSVVFGGLLLTASAIHFFGLVFRVADRRAGP